MSAGAALHFACPGRIDQPTGGYRYDAAILAGLAAQGRRVVLHELAGRFPDADDTARAAARGCVAADTARPEVEACIVARKVEHEVAAATQTDKR